MIEFDVPLWQIIQAVVAIFLPIVVGLVTTRVTAANRKAVLLAGLSVVTSLLTELGHALQTNTTYNLGLALLFAIGTFAVAVATHYGLYKAPNAVGVSISDKVQNTLVTAPADTYQGKHEAGSVG